MRFDVTILGSSSAIPTHGRYPTSQVLNVSGRLFLVDCGEGTQWRLLDLHVKTHKINEIFISHLHGDHMHGLIGLLTSFNLMGRTKALKIFSTKGLDEIIAVHFKYTGGTLDFPLIFVEIDTTQNQLIFEDKLIEVFTIPLKHRIPTCGFLFKEKPKLLNIIPSKIEKYQIPVEKIKEIKKGADLLLSDGRVISNRKLTYPKTAERSYAFCTDTLYDESLIPLIKGVDVLYHESTFLHEMSELAKQTMHSTARQAAAIAKKAGAGQLIIGHYSSRYKDLAPFLDEAQKVFPDTLLGIEGMTFPVVSKNRSAESQ